MSHPRLHSGLTKPRRHDGKVGAADSGGFGNSIAQLHPHSPLVVPANAGTHMWTAPVAQEVSRSDRIACIHMSGLLMRSHWTAGQDGFRDASSKQPRDLCSANGSHGLSRTSDRSILPSIVLLQLRFSRRGEPADRPISYAANAEGTRAPSRARRGAAFK
jgi:hypothetical protein